MQVVQKILTKSVQVRSLITVIKNIEQAQVLCPHSLATYLPFAGARAMSLSVNFSQDDTK